MREIEVKLKVNNLKELEDNLVNHGCVLSDPVVQRDVIYSYMGTKDEFRGKMKDGDIIFRIRYTSDSAILTLKKQRSYEMDNLEYETKVGSPEDMHNILMILNHIPAVEVTKSRRKGRFEGYEVCLDEVERLGSFVELEKLTNDDDDPELVIEDLLQKLEMLGLSRKDQVFTGYDSQIFALDNK